MPTVPMFPLNTVVFPGVVMPLHVFEDRYRAMMRDLLAVPDAADRVIGIVAIREGYEVGEPGNQHGVQSAHRIGTLVQVTGVERYDDGRFDIEVTGRQRLRMEQMHTSGEYFTADVELLEDLGAADPVHRAAAEVEAERTLQVFADYHALVSNLRGADLTSGEYPRDPEYLSYLLAANCLLTLRERQLLLEAEDATTRLGLLTVALRAEIQAIKAIPSLPATELARTRWSPN